MQASELSDGPHGGLFAFWSLGMELIGEGWTGEAAEGAPEVPVRREHLVVVGNGMAGCRAVEELLARDPNRYRVTIFGAEPHVNYNRIMLSSVLAGDKSVDEIVSDPATLSKPRAESSAGSRALTSTSRSSKS